MSFLRMLESFRGVFECLLGMFVASLVILLAVVNRGSAVGVCGQFVKLGGPLMRVTWHGSFNPSNHKDKGVLFF